MIHYLVFFLEDTKDLESGCVVKVQLQVRHFLFSFVAATARTRLAGRIY
jgi:hypothetical protein